MTINTNISSDNSNSNNKTSSQYKKSSAIKQKIFAPNIPTKPRLSTIAKANNNNDLFSPERVLNPTKLDLESRQKQTTTNGNGIEEIERIKQLQLQTEQIQKLQQQQIQQLQNVNNPKTKSVILKIKRKIDDDALPSIVIERPRKKAFLDSFKDFGLNSNDDANPEKSNNNDKEIDNDKDDYKLPKDLQQIPTSPQQQSPTISTDKDKKLFTLITTLDDPSKSSKFVSKFQQRIEEFNQKGVISSPKQLESKKERTIKNRKESRYKQINTNRNLFTKEEKELFQDHDVIELERTILDPNNLRGSTLSKEEEELISNYKSLLDQHLGDENASSNTPMETKYVYDYYYFNPSIDQSSQLLRLHQENPDSIETVQLPPEDDFYDILDGGNSDNSSVDSENWYREYPSSEDDDDGFDDFDNYHGFGKRQQQDSDDDYEHDEYEIDGDYYNEDDYDDYI